MLYDINEVCVMLGVTSRTLRFYEQKGIIESTKEGMSSRRKYTKEQINSIRNVLVLRTLGISVKSIKELQSENTDLKNAVLARRAEIFSWINEKRHEIDLLNEALAVIDSGDNIFEKHIGEVCADTNGIYTDIAIKCSRALIERDYQTLEAYFSKKLSEYMPEKAFLAMMRDTLAPVGEFVALDKTITDSKYNNIIYQYVRYEKMGLVFKFVFYNGKIDGLWTSYCEI